MRARAPAIPGLSLVLNRALRVQILNIFNLRLSNFVARPRTLSGLADASKARGAYRVMRSLEKKGQSRSKENDSPRRIIVAALFLLSLAAPIKSQQGWIAAQ